MSRMAIINAVVKEEKKIGLHRCVKCGKNFSRKELHLQDVWVILNPGHIENKIYGISQEFNNIFIKSGCPFCKFHNQDEKNLVVINCKLKLPNN